MPRGKDQLLKGLSGYIILVGGGSVFQNFADRIGADGYAVNAEKAVSLAKKLFGSVA